MVFCYLLFCWYQKSYFAQFYSFSNFCQQFFCFDSHMYICFISAIQLRCSSICFFVGQPSSPTCSAACSEAASSLTLSSSFFSCPWTSGRPRILPVSRSRSVNQSVDTTHFIHTGHFIHLAIHL